MSDLVGYMEEAVDRDEMVLTFERITDETPDPAVVLLRHEGRSISARLVVDERGMRAEVTAWVDGERAATNIAEAFGQVLITVDT